MNFTDNSFFLFVVVFVLIFHTRLIPKPHLILIGSYVFYAFWDWRFLSLLMVLSFVNYSSALLMQKIEMSKRSFLLLITLTFNLGILSIFKYFNFFITGLSIFLQALGFEASSPTLVILVPLGISFYIFQISSYIIDVNGGEIEPTRNLILFSAFSSYFPHMAAGPIMSAKKLIPQIESDYKNLSLTEVCTAFGLIAGGLIRKIVIADTLAPMVNRVFENPERFDWRVLLLGTIAFSLQIYGDFSGYSNMARGISRLLGIELISNFSQPYFSRNIQFFWRTWHISLSNWFREYLYIPLGGNRRGKIRTSINLMFVMIVAGLWHGASFGFVVWGFLHGLALVLHNLVKTTRTPKRGGIINSSWFFISTVVTFSMVTLLWIPFRLPSTSQSLSFVNGIISRQSGTFDRSDLILVSQMLILTALVDIVEKALRLNYGRSRDFLVARPIFLGIATGLSLLLSMIYRSSEVVPFIYFQF